VSVNAEAMLTGLGIGAALYLLAHLVLWIVG
jgi:hypothetical protein